jgi:hypothetical protein
MKHFKTIPVVEKEALTFFIYMVKCIRGLSILCEFVPHSGGQA